jgi:hypothetical protein
MKARWLRLRGAALMVPLSLLFHACSSPSSSTTEGTSSGGITYNSTLVQTITLAGGATKELFTISSVDSGGGNVTEIVVDTPGGWLYVDAMSSSAMTYFEYDYGSNSVSGSYSAFYTILYHAITNPTQGNNGGPSLGVMIPVRHVSSGDFPSGDYTLALSNGQRSPATVNVYLVKKNDPDFSSGGITLNLFVYTVDGVNPVITSVDDAQAVKNYITTMFQQVGVTVSAINVEFREDAAAIAQAGGSDSGLSAFLESASIATAGRSDTGINCFLMPQLPGGILGMDGAIPGPGFQHGTASSGLVALATSFGYLFPGYTSHESDQMYLSLTLAHEIGHYLGLYHPSERDGKTHDPLSDTPECGTSYDTDHDGYVSGPECRGVNTEYLMFWTDDLGYLTSGNFQTRISSQQGEVMNTHPAVL